MFSQLQLKLILRAIGISELSIRFDTENKQIESRFTQFGQKQSKTIPFGDIEAMFSAEPQGGQAAAEPPIGRPADTKDAP